MRFWAVAVGLTLLLLAAALFLFVSDFRLDCRYCWQFWPHHHASDERNTAVSLKAITSAQAYFRANNRDADGVNKFWRSDIAGLYAFAPGGGPAIPLIELSLAAADDRPATNLAPYSKRTPHHGYWYRALRHADETAIDAIHRFAAECHPADYPKSGRYTFIVDENNTIFRADLGHGRGLNVYPTDDELKTKWAKVD